MNTDDTERQFRAIVQRIVGACGQTDQPLDSITVGHPNTMDQRFVRQVLSVELGAVGLGAVEILTRTLHGELTLLGIFFQSMSLH